MDIAISNFQMNEGSFVSMYGCSSQTDETRAFSKVPPTESAIMLQFSLLQCHMLNMLETNRA